MISPINKFAGNSASHSFRYVVWRIVSACAVTLCLGGCAKRAVPPDEIKTEQGFKVELIHAAADEGSWICMAADPEGRFTIATENTNFLLRVTVTNGSVAQIERIHIGLGRLMGISYGEGSLFVDGMGPHSWGLYRIPITNGTLGAPKFLRYLNGTGEHGSHQVLVGPDHKLYVVSGNWSLPPKDISSNSPLRHYGDDQLLPTTPGRLTLNSGYRPLEGFILRMNLDGKNCELWAGGTRNIYCIDFNRDGELFGVDNDNESDVGASWYEPCRILQCVSGGDYGYREGPANFPEYYDDILPSVARLGLGAPTGVKFAPENCSFPSDYSDACFVEDWAYGRLMAIHLTERGASYSGRVETILRGHPLNLTGLQFGADGALYFITGGRDSPSGLYRLTYVGPRNGKKEGAAKDSSAVAARRLRRRLEALNGPPSEGAVDFVWPYLNSPDRWIRYAARVALEAQGVASWKERALAETNVNGALTALLALARCGRMKDQAECLAALDRFPCGVLNDEQKLAKLRVLEVSFSRQGKPDEGAVEREIKQLRPYFPAGDFDLDHELSQLMLYLDAPNAVSNTVWLLKHAVTREDQLYYIMRLRTITRGWTPETRQACQTWFADPGAEPPRAENRRNFQDLNLPYADGIGVSAYLDDFRSELAAASGLSTNGLPPITRELGDDVVSRQTSDTLAFVKNWTLAELGSKIDATKSKRSLSRGKAAFVNGQCALCHRFNGVGGVAGPDLTAVSSRMTALQILQSILEPSQTISDPYKNTLLFLTNGDTVCGRVVERTADKLTLMTDLIHQTTIEIKTQDIQSQRLSNVSPMPESLLNSMTENEIWDLLNYLRFGAAAPSAPARD